MIGKNLFGRKFSERKKKKNFVLKSFFTVWHGFLFISPIFKVAQTFTGKVTAKKMGLAPLCRQETIIDFFIATPKKKKFFLLSKATEEMRDYRKTGGSDFEGRGERGPRFLGWGAPSFYYFEKFVTKWNFIIFFRAPLVF